jgi:hypothetical protein
MQRLKEVAFSNLKNMKNRLDREIDTFKKCLQEDKDCDPVRKAIYITVTSITVLLISAGAAGLTYWVMKRGMKDDSEDLPSEEPQISQKPKREEIHEKITQLSKEEQLDNLREQVKDMLSEKEYFILKAFGRRSDELRRKLDLAQKLYNESNDIVGMDEKISKLEEARSLLQGDGYLV